MQGIYHQSLTGNQGQLGPFDPSIIILAGTYAWDGLKMEMGGTLSMG